jgi:hypothetical protein
MWDDEAMRTLEVPLAKPIASPKHAPADCYYRIPLRAIYKQYPVYAPGREPAGYVERLKKQEPVIVWDDASQKRMLETEAEISPSGPLWLKQRFLLGPNCNCSSMCPGFTLIR